MRQLFSLLVPTLAIAAAACATSAHPIATPAPPPPDATPSARSMPLLAAAPGDARAALRSAIDSMVSAPEPSILSWA